MKAIVDVGTGEITYVEWTQEELDRAAAVQADATPAEILAVLLGDDE